MTKQLRKLSKETAIELKDGDFVVYDTRAYSPQRVTTLTYHEVGELTLLFTEGLCPSCLRDMPEVNDVVCEHCHNAAALARVGGECETCEYSQLPASGGHCYMFKEKPIGRCAQWQQARVGGGEVETK